MGTAHPSSPPAVAPSPPPPQYDPASGCLLRLFWMVGGNVLLFFLLLWIVERRPRLGTWPDLAYLAVLAALVAARYVDIRYCHGQTGKGAPATLAHWRRHALGASVIGSGAWVVARLLVRWLGHDV